MDSSSNHHHHHHHHHRRSSVVHHRQCSCKGRGSTQSEAGLRPVRLSFASISISALPDEDVHKFAEGGAHERLIRNSTSSTTSSTSGSTTSSIRGSGGGSTATGAAEGYTQEGPESHAAGREGGSGVGGTAEGGLRGVGNTWRLLAEESMSRVRSTAAAAEERWGRVRLTAELLWASRPGLPVFRLPFFDDADEDGAISALNHVYAGTMARTLSQVVCHPVDTVKTRMQIKDPSKKLRKWRRKISKKAFELGPLDIDNWFFKGPGDLFRGVWGAILGTIPNAMLYFIAYESTKRRLEKQQFPGGLVHVASASVGTFAASIVRVPADTLKHRVQAYMHKNVFEAFKVIIETEGIAGLYRGFWPTLLRDVPEIAIQFAVYEKLRSVVREKRQVEKLTTPEHLMLGACAGAIAATCTIPLDLVKTRQQCGISESIHRVVMSVLAESGPVGLFAGLGPRAFHVSIMSAVFFGLFEYCKLVMKPNRSPNDKLYLPKIWNKRRDHIWKRQFVYTE